MNKLFYSFMTFLLLFSLAAREAAEESEKFPKKLTNANKVQWTAKLSTKEGIEFLEILDEKKKMLLKQPADFAIHGVVSADAFSFSNSSKNYVIALWSKGAHGQNVKILEPGAESQVLYSFNSSWPIAYEIKKNKIIIEATGDMNPDGQPDKEIITWGPMGLISKKTIKP